jgi:hypothetical protein
VLYNLITYDQHVIIVVIQCRCMVFPEISGVSVFLYSSFDWKQTYYMLKWY